MRSSGRSLVIAASAGCTTTAVAGMYTTTQASNINGMGIVDAGSGTIDPAALNAPSEFATPLC